MIGLGAFIGNLARIDTITSVGKSAARILKAIRMALDRGDHLDTLIADIEAPRKLDMSHRDDIDKQIENKPD